MRLAFFGTPPAAVPALRSLTGISEVALVVTRPDRPQGRSLVRRAPAVKQAALELGLEVVQPERAAEVADRLAGLTVAVVVAYGQLLPARLLSIPRHGFVNLHFSLLPRWRGAAPVAHAILAGDRTTGVSLMRLDPGMDTGPLIGIWSTQIGAQEPAGELTLRLAEKGAEFLTDLLPRWVAGKLVAVPQPETGVTMAPRLSVGDARIHPADESDTILRKIRAFAPKPGAWGLLTGERFKLLKATAAPGQSQAPGGINLQGERVMLGTGDGLIELLEVQIAGGRAMSAIQWARGRRHPEAILE